MSHSPIDSLRRRLVDQLVLFDEQRVQFVDTYFSHLSSFDRQKEIQFLEQYISTVESVVGGLVEGHSHSSLPKVLIGCQISLLYASDDEVDSLTICLPDAVNPDLGRISFLSPIGRQTLMKSLNDTIHLETPMGSQEVMIREIKFVDW